MYIDGSKELAPELSINGEIDVGRKCQGDTSIERGGQNPDLGIALSKEPARKKIQSVGEHKIAFSHRFEAPSVSVPAICLAFISSHELPPPTLPRT